MRSLNRNLYRNLVNTLLMAATLKVGGEILVHDGTGSVFRDETTRQLGEVALVSKKSPIRQMGKIFYNGLIDELRISAGALTPLQFLRAEKAPGLTIVFR